MSNLKTVYLHIGTHKTGTTSIQQYMYAHNKSHKKFGIDFYNGLYKPANHVELQIATMRENRMSPYKFQHNIRVDKQYKQLVQNLVRDFLTNTEANKAIFFCRGTLLS